MCGMREIGEYVFDEYPGYSVERNLWLSVPGVDVANDFDDSAPSSV